MTDTPVCSSQRTARRRTQEAEGAEDGERYSSSPQGKRTGSWVMKGDCEQEDLFAFLHERDTAVVVFFPEPECRCSQEMKREGTGHRSEDREEDRKVEKRGFILSRSFLCPLDFRRTSSPSISDGGGRESAPLPSSWPWPLLSVSSLALFPSPDLLPAKRPQVHSLVASVFSCHCWCCHTTLPKELA